MLNAGRVGEQRKRKASSAAGPLSSQDSPAPVERNLNHTSREWSLQGKVRVSKHLRLAGLSAGPGS